MIARRSHKGGMLLVLMSSSGPVEEGWETLRADNVIAKLVGAVPPNCYERMTKDGFKHQVRDHWGSAQFTLLHPTTRKYLGSSERMVGTNPPTKTSSGQDDHWILWWEEASSVQELIVEIDAKLKKETP